MMRYRWCVCSFESLAVRSLHLVTTIDQRQILTTILYCISKRALIVMVTAADGGMSHTLSNYLDMIVDMYSSYDRSFGGTGT